MRVLSIGDVHGRRAWKDRVVNNVVDKIVFIGDYFDSRDGISSEDQVTNFKQIVALKESRPNDVHLLVGNHDLSYIVGLPTCSGYTDETQKASYDIIMHCLKNDLFEIAVYIDDVIYSHAGITATWVENIFGFTYEPITKVIEAINQKFREDNHPHRWLAVQENPIPGRNPDPFGDDIFQSPCWVRPNSLLEDCIYQLKQVVGHTSYPIAYDRPPIVFIDSYPSAIIYTDGKDWDYAL